MDASSDWSQLCGSVASMEEGEEAGRAEAGGLLPGRHDGDHGCAGHEEQGGIVEAQSEGAATEDVGATYSAGALEIGFNARYLLDITSQIEGKEVRFLLSDAGSPTLIEDSEDDGTLYVLMPMRV